MGTRPDWLSGSCPPEPYDVGDRSVVWAGHRMAEALAEYLPGDLWPASTRHHGAGLRGDGFEVFWQGLGSASGLVYVQVRGEAFDSLSEAEALELLRMANGWRLAATRFDLCRDVLGLSVAGLRDAVVRGGVVSRAHSIDYTEGLRGANGRTLTIGSRSSDRYVRIYDRRGPTRIEVQLGRGMAAAAVERVLASGSFDGEWRAQVTSAVRFASSPAWAGAVA